MPNTMQTHCESCGVPETCILQDDQYLCSECFDPEHRTHLVVETGYDRSTVVASYAHLTL